MTDPTPDPKPDPKSTYFGDLKPDVFQLVVKEIAEAYERGFNAGIKSINSFKKKGISD